jgi:hypothetical protein
MQVASSPSKPTFEKKRNNIMVRNNYNEPNNATFNN